MEGYQGNLGCGVGCLLQGRGLWDELLILWISHQGEWEDDDRCGLGELMYNSGDKYKGQWLDDKQRMYCPAQLLFFYF